MMLAEGLTAIPEPQRCVTCHGSGKIQIVFRTKRKPCWKDCPMCEGLGWRALPWLHFYREPGGPIDHVLTSSKSHWHTTACGIWTPNGEIRAEFKRRCRKCVAEVKRIGASKLSEQEAVA